LEDLGRKVRVLVGEKLWTVLNDRQPAAKPAVRLSEFEADVTTTDQH
jgi:hypothetical protein